MQNILTLSPSISIGRYLPLKLNLRLFWIFSLILIGVLLVFYIFQINSVIQKTYLLQGYERKLDEFAEKNKNLEINSAKMNSLENIENLVKNLNYEEVGKIRYIRVLETDLVTK